MSPTDSPTEPAAVVVTGANRNIGAHIAHRFIDDGFSVIAVYRSQTDETSRLAERGARLVQGEFADTTSTLAIAAAIRERAPRLRGLVHNASAFSPTDDDTSAASEQFQDFFEVHMRAPYLLNTELAEALAGSREAPGDIVQITDIQADNPKPMYDVYCATKAGLQNLGVSFAKRFAPTVKVNMIQPGPISFQDWVDEDARQETVSATPLAKTGTPEAIYRAVKSCFDNPFQTGAVIAVDGGLRWSG
ncbi:SDR family oxidoreductase [uncultured Salinisphaera sp.]|uniref:SDR family oxidoreductase n=1 Tax=uncultured Salinisphaera sp. TaxID=359372 RepID=UPI0032B27857|tara:strand:+ start:3420 stop:4160 length:741 start_codon:yes stop_codon:yes gene_type:complete